MTLATRHHPNVRLSILKSLSKESSRLIPFMPALTPFKESLFSLTKIFAGKGLILHRWLIRKHRTMQPHLIWVNLTLSSNSPTNIMHYIRRYGVEALISELPTIILFTIFIKVLQISNNVKRMRECVEERIKESWTYSSYSSPHT